MASWNEILDRFGHMPSQYDLVRREYLKELSNYTDRNTILYDFRKIKIKTQYHDE